MDETNDEHSFSIFLSYILDLATHNIKNTASWKIPVSFIRLCDKIVIDVLMKIGLQLLWGLILIVGITFLPESP